MKLTFRLIFSSVIGLVLLSGCETKPPVLSNTAAIEWTRYAHPTLAYVVHYEDRFLGLEFRTPETTLNEVAQHMIDFFQLS